MLGLSTKHTTSGTSNLRNFDEIISPFRTTKPKAPPQYPVSGNIELNTRVSVWLPNYCTIGNAVGQATPNVRLLLVQYPPRNKWSLSIFYGYTDRGHPPIKNHRKF